MGLGKKQVNLFNLFIILVGLGLRYPNRLTHLTRLLNWLCQPVHNTTRFKQLDMYIYLYIY